MTRSMMIEHSEAATLARAGVEDSDCRPNGGRSNGGRLNDARMDLEAVLTQAVQALTVLDAEAIEALAELLSTSLESVVLPESPAEWARLRSRHWILGRLLGGTGQRLEMLRRISSSPAPFASYAAAAIREPRSSTKLLHRRTGRFDPAG